jgi:hypothetical protein
MNGHVRSIEVKPGTRWVSAVCDAEVIVIKSPPVAVALECGGVPMEAAPGQGRRVPAVHDSGEAPRVGKRYTDEDTGLVVLCTKGGSGVLSAGGRPLSIMATKPLPASD